MLRTFELFITVTAFPLLKFLFAPPNLKFMTLLQLSYSFAFHLFLTIMAGSPYFLAFFRYKQATSPSFSLIFGTALTYRLNPFSSRCFLF